MTKNIPEWALRKALPEDRLVVRDAQSRGTMQIKLPDLKALRSWAKRQGWPTPWLSFAEAFLVKMLDGEASFELAIRESGIEIHIPRQEHTISAERLGELDGLYDERSTEGRPIGWRSLVEELREIRRAVEAGVVMKVEGGQTFQTWEGFYSWAHGRYHMLEDGCDPWIGSDD